MRILLYSEQKNSFPCSCVRRARVFNGVLRNSDSRGKIEIRPLHSRRSCDCACNTACSCFSLGSGAPDSQGHTQGAPALFILVWGKPLALGTAKGGVTGICSSAAAGNSCCSQNSSRGTVLLVLAYLLLCSAVVTERGKPAHCHLRAERSASAAHGSCLQRRRGTAVVPSGAASPAL